MNHPSIRLSRSVRAFLLASSTGVLIVASPGAASAAGCQLADPVARLTMVERNIASAERMLTDTNGKQTVAALRGRVSSLRASGSGFRAKAAPLESSCEKLTAEGKALESAKRERDAAVKPLLEQRRQIYEKYKALNAALKAAQGKRDADLKPPRAQLAPLNAQMDNQQQRVAAHNARKGSCGKDKGCLAAYNAAAAQLNAERDSINARRRPIQQQIEAVRAEYEAKRKSIDEQYKAAGDGKGLTEKIKAIEAVYAAKLKDYATKRNAWFEAYKAYANSVKAWDDELKSVWGDSAKAVQQAVAARQQQGGGQASGRGGEIGKLSGPFAKGGGERGTGAAGIPGAVTQPGEGGAKGQARAAAGTGQQGVKSGSDSGAAFQAGRVFDRGDVKVGGASGKDAVDARGVQPRTYSKAVRESAGWQRLDAREQGHREAKTKAEAEIKAIEQKIQSGQGNKGQLQVDLVRARDKADKAQNQINQVTVEKQSFAISFEEKPAASGGATNPSGTQ